MFIESPHLGYTPKRIVSLVPSLTELLFDLGLDAETIGITKFCIHPAEWFRNKTRVGGTKTVNIERVKKLKPDLIIANKEENIKEQIDALSKFAPTYVSDIRNLDDAIVMIHFIGQLTNRVELAMAISLNIRQGFTNLQRNIKRPVSKVLYMIWHKPWMSVGADTFINDMLSKMGQQNALQHLKRYPELSDDAIADSKADIVYLSSEPFPFKEKHIALVRELLPDAKIYLVDGEMFSWYGSRLMHTPGYFEFLLRN